MDQLKQLEKQIKALREAYKQIFNSDEGKLIISTDHNEMKSWILEQLHVRQDFIWSRNGYYYVNKKPRWIVNTKYTNMYT